MNWEARFQWLRRRDRRSQAISSAPRPVQLLELHVSHACNLTCESCSHYSNHGHRSHVGVEEADRWMASWAGRLDVRQFDLLGGEPTVHPELAKFVPLVRSHWPRALIRILTNGFFLHRHPELPALMAEDGNVTIRLSIHHDAPEYRDRLRPILDLLAGWRTTHGISVDVVESHAQWTRRYHGYGASMLPFDDQMPRQSWEICPAKYCKQLFQGQLWKCAPLAYLQLQQAKYQLGSQWDRYIRYRALTADCSWDELDAFLAREEEDACSMCPAERHPFALPVPVRSRARVEAAPSGAAGKD